MRKEYDFKNAKPNPYLLYLHKIKKLNKKISQKPIHIDNYQQIREVNRSL